MPSLLGQLFQQQNNGINSIAGPSTPSASSPTMPVANMSSGQIPIGILQALLNNVNQTMPSTSANSSAPLIIHPGGFFNALMSLNGMKGGVK